ncbi:MAG: hypothetical protein JWO79_1296 [Actinomycetia bacterium]|nr:hypothetical protein [Actinomycetes bacterium]
MHTDLPTQPRDGAPGRLADPVPGDDSTEVSQYLTGRAWNELAAARRHGDLAAAVLGGRPNLDPAVAASLAGDLAAERTALTADFARRAEASLGAPPSWNALRPDQPGWAGTGMQILTPPYEVRGTAFLAPMSGCSVAPWSRTRASASSTPWSPVTDPRTITATPH